MAKKQQAILPNDKIVNTKEQWKTITQEDGKSCEDPRVEDKPKEDEKATHNTHPTNDLSLEQSSAEAST